MTEFPSAASFDRTVQEIIDEIEQWRSYPGYVAATCHECRKKANVVNGGGWHCVCGAWNAQQFGGPGEFPHRSPDLGPERHVIMAAEEKGVPGKQRSRRCPSNE